MNKLKSTDKNSGLRKDEINYFMLNEVSTLKDDLFEMKNTLERFDPAFTLNEQRVHFIEIIDFDLSMSELSMYWRSAEGTADELESYTVST